jgi:hypothetical protein
MSQRIDIINNSRILSTSKSKPLQKRIYNSLLLISVFSLLSLLCILGVVFSMLVDWFNLKFNLTWATSSAIVISSIFSLIFLSESLYAYVLLKHIKRTQGISVKNHVKAVNDELEILVSTKTDLNNNIFTFILGICIITCALLVKFFETDFIYMYLWNFLKIPLLVFYILFFRQVVKNLVQIKRNNLLFEITCLR